MNALDPGHPDTIVADCREIIDEEVRKKGRR